MHTAMVDSVCLAIRATRRDSHLGALYVDRHCTLKAERDSVRLRRTSLHVHGIVGHERESSDAAGYSALPSRRRAHTQGE